MSEWAAIRMFGLIWMSAVVIALWVMRYMGCKEVRLAQPDRWMAWALAVTGIILWAHYFLEAKP